MSKLLNVKEVAELLGVNWRTVLRLADRGELAWGMKIGPSLRRWTPEMVDEYLAKQIAAAARGRR